MTRPSPVRKSPAPHKRTGFLTVAVILVVMMTVALVALAPRLETVGVAAVLLIGVIAAMGLGFVLLLPNRRPILLGLFIFMVTFSGIDKWFFFHVHTGGAPGVQVSVSDIMLFVLYALWAWESLTGRAEPRRSTRPAIVAVPVALALLWMGVSALSLLNAESSLFVALELLQMLKLLLFLIYVAYNVRSRSDLAAAAIGLSSAVFVHGSFAIAERFGGGSLGLGFLGEQEGLVVDFLGGTFHRVGGLIGHPVLLGAFFASTLAFLLAILVRSTTFRARALVLIALLVGAAGLVLTLSRGSWIAWFFALATFLFFAQRKKLLQVGSRGFVRALLGLTLVAILAASPLIYQRFVNSDEGSVQGRSLLNKVAVDTIREHPVVGVGLNNWSIVVREYDETGISTLARDPVHNVYLLLWAETGIVGLLAFLLFIGSVLRAGVLAFVHSTDDDISSTGLACAVAIGAILIMGLASWELRLTPESQLLWVVSGLAIAMHRLAAERQDVQG